MRRNPQVPKALVDLLASLRAAFLTYRNAHWQVKGTGYYGNHLLLQRLYEEATKHVDTVAEKMVGFYGPAAVEASGHQMNKISELIEEFEASSGGPLERSLAAAEHVQKSLSKAYSDLESRGELTLGWGDTLPAIASNKDSHIYLLRQALDGKPVMFSKTRKRNLLRY
jgi:starvation-inducible DNA-binding protein